MQELFKQLGFSSNEVKVYLSLAEVGKAQASLLAKKLNLPRSTVYSVLDNLVSRGVVKMEQSSVAASYVVNSPDSLERMVKREREAVLAEIEKKESAASGLVEQITPCFKNQNYSVPKLQFFDGAANVENMLYSMQEEWQLSISIYDSTWWGYQDPHFVETYFDWLKSYWVNKLPKEAIKLLSHKSKVEQELAGKITNREIKVAPKGLEFSSTIWVLGDYVVTIITRQKPHYAYQLKDPVFAANQRAMFRHFWQLV